jgi:hypothetical protein
MLYAKISAKGDGMSNRKFPSAIFTILAVIALGALLSACGLTGTPTPTFPPPTATPLPRTTPTPPTGWNIHSKPAFQIALPSSWQEIPLDDSSLKNAIDAASNDNPYLADTLRGILTSGQNKNLVFYAADEASTVVITNVSISRTSIPNGTSVEKAAHDYADALPQLLQGAKLVVVDAPLEVNGQQAGEVDYDLPLVNPGGQVVTLRGVQYLFVSSSGDAYVVTVTGDASAADKFVPLARQIAKSFMSAKP